MASTWPWPMWQSSVSAARVHGCHARATRLALLPTPFLIRRGVVVVAAVVVGVGVGVGVGGVGVECCCRCYTRSDTHASMVTGVV